MPQALNGFPNAAQHEISTELSGVGYVLVYTWSERLQYWSVDLYAEDRTPLVLGRRMAPGWTPWIGLVLEGLPTGVVLIRGADGYARADLGDTVRLVRFTTAEMPTATPSDLVVTVGGP